MVTTMLMTMAMAISSCNANKNGNFWSVFSEIPYFSKRKLLSHFYHRPKSIDIFLFKDRPHNKILIIISNTERKDVHLNAVCIMYKIFIKSKKK